MRRWGSRHRRYQKSFYCPGRDFLKKDFSTLLWQMQGAICATHRMRRPLFILIVALALPFITRAAHLLRLACGAWGRLNGDVRCLAFGFVHQLISQLLHQSFSKI
jgi:hypothetical protein